MATVYCTLFTLYTHLLCCLQTSYSEVLFTARGDPNNSIQPKVDSQEHICKTNKSLDMPSFHANLGWKQWAKCIKIRCNFVWFYTHHNSIIKIYQYARQIQSMHHQQALDSFQSVTVLIKIKKENPSHTVIMFYLAKL